MARLGIIGGSGLYQIETLEILKEIDLDTPFGKPSDVFTLGKLFDQEIVFLPRHGRGHRLIPSQVNYRANIYGMKQLGVHWLLSVSAVGSLREDYHPMDLVVIDQFFDRTNQGRSNTFFGDGIVAHIPFAQPLCPDLRHAVFQAGQESGASMKWGGTYLNMEGPAFSTLAESQTYRRWGMDVIGMTQMSEARLAREAEICYVTLAMVTDFDCWHEAETGMTVSVKAIIEYLHKNAANAKEIIRRMVQRMPFHSQCTCQNALRGAIITDRSVWPQATIARLGPILEKYL